jgi:hypothetical protein
MAGDRARLGGVGERYHGLLISDKEMSQVLAVVSDRKVFDWQPMTAVSPFPTNHVVLLVYGADPTGKDSFHCSIGSPKTAVGPLTKLLEPFSGAARETLNGVVAKLRGSE